MFSHNEEIAKKRGYRVDKYGNAFSKANKKVGTSSRGGYYYFAFRVDGEIKKVYIHRMQAFQKYGKRIYEDGILIRHLNNNFHDNSRNNISIGTAKDNYYDIPYKERLKNRERLNYNSKTCLQKYNEKDLEQIRIMRAEGASYNEIMAKFNISSKGTLSYIINKRLSPRVGETAIISL